MPASTSWRKSTFSEGGASACVEVAFAEARVGVRDSKNVGGPLLIVSPTIWLRFVHASRRLTPNPVD
ncbi:MAG: DUF397 domain-containing protein [Pseudonocardiaceae bacterium]|nr:DUF397 domain-containing protein [Pseudonocardiaceae bacterium]